MFCRYECWFRQVTDGISANPCLIVYVVCRSNLILSQQDTQAQQSFVQVFEVLVEPSLSAVKAPL